MDRTELEPKTRRGSQRGRRKNPEGGGIGWDDCGAEAAPF